MLLPPSRVLSFARLLRSATGLVFMAQAGGCAAGGQVEEDSAPGCGPLIKICTVKSAHRPLEKMYRSYKLLLMICARARAYTHTHTHTPNHLSATHPNMHTNTQRRRLTHAHPRTHTPTHPPTHPLILVCSLARSFSYLGVHTRTHAHTPLQSREPAGLSSGHSHSSQWRDSPLRTVTMPSR